MTAILHGLLQKAKLTVTEQYETLRIDPAGQIWRLSPLGWIITGKLADPQDREDFLLGKLSQEDR